MYIYTSRNGEKRGPFTIYRVKEMLDVGELSQDDLGWHEGLDKWCPVKDIPIIASTLESLEKKGHKPDGKTEDKTHVTVFPYWEHQESKENEIDDYHLQESPFQPNSALPLPSSKPDDNEVPTPESKKNVHPFLRFWARSFDYLLLNMMVWFVFDPPQISLAANEVQNLSEFFRRLDELIPREERIRFFQIQGGAFFVWNFIEALLISSFGTTPGKMLFNFRVLRKNGTQLNYLEALGRSIIIWIFGIGMGLPVLQIVAMILALFFLLKKGEALWDRTLQAKVHHKPLGPQQVFLAAGAYLVLLSLQILVLF